MMQEDVAIGGEESGGLSISGHIPEKDGLLANLLVVEMVAKKGQKLSQLWQSLIKKYGNKINRKTNLKLTEEKKNKFIKRLKENTPQELAKQKVTSVNKMDGVKLVLADGSWVLARPSGTEPLVRLYVESDTEEKVKQIAEAVKALIPPPPAGRAGN